MRNRNALVAALLILGLLLSARFGLLGDFSRHLTLDVSASVLRGLGYPKRKAAYLWNLWQFRAEVLRENDALRYQLEALQRKYDATRDLQARCQELERMLNLHRDYDYELLPAPVLFRDDFSWSKTLIVGRGRRDGVLPGMPVVQGGELIGKVTEAGYLNSKVLLISDTTFRAGVRLKPCGATGIYNGQGEENPRIDFLPLDAKVAIGDEVYTSGLGSVFPAGYHIGSVIRVERDERNLYQRADVQSASNLDELGNVTIIKHAPPDLSLSPEPPEE